MTNSERIEYNHKNPTVPQVIEELDDLVLRLKTAQIRAEIQAAENAGNQEEQISFLSHQVKQLQSDNNSKRLRIEFLERKLAALELKTGEAIA